MKQTSTSEDIDYDKYVAFTRKLAKTQIFVLDVETKKTETFDGKDLLGVAIGIPNGIGLDTFYFDPVSFAGIHDLLQGKEMIGYSLMFDLEILQQNGYVHQGFIWDVLVMLHLCNENEFNFSLDALSGKYLKQEKGVVWGENTIDISKLEKIYGWDDIPFVFMSQYAEQDVTLTWYLYLRARGDLEKQSLSKVYRAHSRYIVALQHLVQEGLLVDWDYLDVLDKEALSEMESLKEMIGFQPSKRKQLDELLYEQLKLPVVKVTKSNQRAQDTEALERLARRHSEHAELLRSILRWRNLSKAHATWYEGFRIRRTARDRIHPGLKIHGTTTGRLSSAEPNLQQIPRDSERVKRLFLDPPGYVLIELDWVGVELKLGSYYAKKVGNDTRMFDLLRDGLDAHSDTAQSIGAYGQITDRSLARQVGKTGNFAWIYGVGPKTFADQLFKLYKFDCSEDQAYEWTEAFHELNPGFRIANRRYAEFHRQHGYVEMWTKRRARIRSFGRNATIKHHIAFNRVVQGGVGQLLMEATVKISEAIKAETINARMCLTVHDSLWFHIPEDNLDTATAQIIEIMETPATKRFDLPFTVEPKALNRSHLHWNGQQWNDKEGT